MATDRWLELLVRMVAGESEEPPMVGILEARMDEDEERTEQVRVYKHGGRWRIETLGGAPLLIRGHDHLWVFGVGDVPNRHAVTRDGWVRPHGTSRALIRREPWDWQGDDFTRPTVPPFEVTVHGRRAWEVELAPPDHKPSPLVMVIDAEHGMVYEQRSVQFGVLHRWVELEQVERLDDTLFAWQGEAVEWEVSSSPVTDEEIERERAEQHAWVRGAGLASLAVSASVELYPHERDDDGSFYASFHASTGGFVARRPTSDEPWDVGQEYPHTDRWSDDSWDWWVGSEESADQVAQIRRQLSEPRPDHP